MSWRERKIPVRKRMKKGMKAKEKSAERRGLRSVESIISDDMRERPDDVLQNNNVRAFSE